MSTYTPIELLSALSQLPTPDRDKLDIYLVHNCDFSRFRESTGLSPIDAALWMAAPLIHHALTQIDAFNAAATMRECEQIQLLCLRKRRDLLADEESTEPTEPAPPTQPQEPGDLGRSGNPGNPPTAAPSPRHKSTHAALLALQRLLPRPATAGSSSHRKRTPAEYALTQPVQTHHANPINAPPRPPQVSAPTHPPAPSNLTTPNHPTHPHPHAILVPQTARYHNPRELFAAFTATALQANRAPDSANHLHSLRSLFASAATTNESTIPVTDFLNFAQNSPPFAAACRSSVHTLEVFEEFSSWAAATINLTPDSANPSSTPSQSGDDPPRPAHLAPPTPAESAQPLRKVRLHAHLLPDGPSDLIWLITSISLE